MNDANDQLKSRSEVGLPMKGSRTSLLYPFRQRVKVLKCLLDWESENRQVKVMLSMNRKYKWI